jgi:hypothetical protein
MDIRDEFEFRKAYIQEHNPRMTAAEVANAVMQDDPLFAVQWRHAQLTHAAHAPRAPRPDGPSYEAVVAEADQLVTKAAGGLLRPDAMLQVVKTHAGERAYEAAWRRYQLYQQGPDLDQAAIAQAKAREQAVKPRTDWTPDPHDYLKLRHG